MKKRGLLLFGSILVFMAISFNLGDVLTEPEIVTITEIVTVTEERIVYNLVYVDVPVYINHYIDVEVPVFKYRNIYARDFESLEQFTEWYEAQEFTVLFPSGVYLVDCDDYARRLQRTALQQGYSISQALALNGTYYGVRITQETTGHVGNIVLINDIYYWVEPNPERFYIRKIVAKD